MITVKEMSYRYPGSREQTLKNLNFSITPGEIFGFLGPSGAGKSTTQKILIGLLGGFKGEVSLFGAPLSPSPDFYRRMGVGFEFPHFYLNLTARENLRFFGSLYNGNRGLEERITLLLEEVDLGEEGDKRVSQYSKGMKTRLNLCRALLHEPEILFLDEPTSGLDPGNSRMIRSLIRREKQKGKTVFLNTHNMEVASELCDRVAFLVDGTIAAVDTPENFMHAHGVPVVEVTWGDPKTPQTARFPMKNLRASGEFQALLDEGTLRSIHSQEATLEEVFLKVTGRSLQ